MAFQKGNTFGTLGKGRKHPVDCNHCAAVRTGRDPEYQREWRRRTDHGRTVQIRKYAKYGLTGASYDEMLRAQGGKCAICLRAPYGKTGRLAVDHDHKTGQIRGFLCITCNTRLGFLEKYWDKLHDYVARTAVAA